MNIDENFSSDPAFTSNEICSLAMSEIHNMLIEPMQDKMTPEQDSMLAIIGLTFKVMAEKATALEKLEQDKHQEDKSIGFYRN